MLVISRNACTYFLLCISWLDFVIIPASIRSTTAVNSSRLVFRVSEAKTIHLEATVRASDKVVFVT